MRQISFGEFTIQQIVDESKKVRHYNVVRTETNSVIYTNSYLSEVSNFTCRELGYTSNDAVMGFCTALELIWLYNDFSPRKH